MRIGEIEAKHILNRGKLTADGYTLNPYVGCQHACVYCYARFMKRLTGHDEPWGSFVDAKVNAVEIFEKDFRKLRDGEGVFIGSATDAYQPLEIRCGLTRGILRKIVDIRSRSLLPKEFPVSILTKSDLVLRDVDLLKRIPGIEVGFSTAMPNEKARRIFEPRAAPVKQRLEALKTLRREGIATFAFVAPILPGIAELAPLFASLEGKVDYVFGETPNTRLGDMSRIFRAVAGYDRDILPFFRQSLGDREYWKSVGEEFHALAAKHGIAVEGFFRHGG